MREISQLARLILCIVVLATLTGLMGCATSIKYGAPPKIDQLATLTPGVSNVEAVRQALGEPRGYGAVRLKANVPIRTIWFYDYVESSGSQVNLKFLLVYLHQDRYEGYDWFSSASLMQRR